MGLMGSFKDAFAYGSNPGTPSLCIRLVFLELTVTVVHGVDNWHSS